MGKIFVKIKLTNLKDAFLKAAGARKAGPRAVEVQALVDTGATRLYLKPSVIKKLGLMRTDTVRSQTTNGDVIRYKYEPVALELMGRRENFDVVEIPENVPNLLGQVPLEVLDLVVDSRGQRLIPNPAHGGEQMTEEFLLATAPRSDLAQAPV
jgi:clan AA aspartic protease